MNPDPYSDNYWEGPTALRTPASARHAHAAYLLGMAPMPSLLPEFKQATSLQLNSGAFSAADNSVYDDPGHVGLQDSVRIEVRVPVPPMEKTGQPSIATIYFPLDSPGNDVLSQLFAEMDLDPEAAQLGWKSSDDGQKAAPRQLANGDDIQYGFRELAGLQKRRLSKPVFMEVVVSSNLTHQGR